MSGFSDDGQWWWNGAAWVATSQVVIPNMGQPDVPESVLRTAGRFKTIALTSSVSVSPVPDILQWMVAGFAVWSVLVHRRTFRVLRQLKLAQLAQVTPYLLGPSEPIVAAEASLYPVSPIVVWTAIGKLAVVVTEARLLVLESERALDPPRHVVMAAPPSDIQIDVGRAGLFRNPTLFVRRGEHVWQITGTPGVFQPQPVVDAWKRFRSVPSAGSRS